MADSHLDAAQDTVPELGGGIPPAAFAMRSDRPWSADIPPMNPEMV